MQELDIMTSYETESPSIVQRFWLKSSQQYSIETSNQNISSETLHNAEFTFLNIHSKLIWHSAR